MKNILLASLLLPLFACSSGSDTPSNNTATGVFLDSPVINIGYRTETIEGVTNSLGEYEYLEGETVTFFIGDLELPATIATGTVTPLELAGTQDTSNSLVVNIIRLLQTLDKDGNPDNGITITDTSIAGATQVDFNLSEADFAVSPAVVTLISNGGQDSAITELVSAADAIAHFEGELVDSEISFGSLEGTWRNTVTENDFLLLSFLDDGKYMHAEVDFDDLNEISGMEWGTYSRDTNTGKMTVTQTFDNNGDTGFTDFTGAPNLFITLSGDVLTAKTDDDGNGSIDSTFVFQRIASTDILGTWRSTTTENDFLLISFFEDGTYMHAEVDFDDLIEISGMEWGTYSRDASTGQMTVTQTFDGNGDTGFTDFIGVPNLFVNTSSSELTVTIDDDANGTIDDTVIFQRQ